MTAIRPKRKPFKVGEEIVIDSGYHPLESGIVTEVLAVEELRNQFDESLPAGQRLTVRILGKRIRIYDWLVAPVGSKRAQDAINHRRRRSKS